MYTHQSSSPNARFPSGLPVRAGAPSLRAERALPPPSHFRFLVKDGRLTARSADAAQILAPESFDPDAARRSVLSREPVLRPGVDTLGRPIILAYAPGREPLPEAANVTAPEVLVVSMLHFGDALRQAARGLGMGNLAARICVALVENGSLRKASRSLGISHLTAASEIADAIQAAGAHSQSGLVHRLADAWLNDSIDGERVIGLLMTTFGLRLRDAKVASLRAAGLTRVEAARRLGVSQWAMESSCSRVFETLGVNKSPELTRLVIDLMLAADLAELHHGGRTHRIRT